MSIITEKELNTYKFKAYIKLAVQMANDIKAFKGKVDDSEYFEGMQDLLAAIGDRAPLSAPNEAMTRVDLVLGLAQDKKQRAVKQALVLLPADTNSASASPDPEPKHISNEKATVAKVESPPANHAPCRIPTPQFVFGAPPAYVARNHDVSDRESAKDRELAKLERNVSKRVATFNQQWYRRKYMVPKVNYPLPRGSSAYRPANVKDTKLFCSPSFDAALLTVPLLSGILSNYGAQQISPLKTKGQLMSLWNWAFLGIEIPSSCH